MMLPNSNIEKYKYNQLPGSNQNNKMTIHKGISSHMLTCKCFSLFSLNLTNHNSFSFHLRITNILER